MNGIKRVKEIGIYINTKGIDLGKLKTDRSAWIKVSTVQIQKSNENRVQFPLPVNALNLMFEFTIQTQSSFSAMKLDRGASKYANFGIENPDVLGVVLFNTEK